jgi:uncharacterized protein (TIGR03435 family)
MAGQAAAQQPRFDVASVKQCRDENDIGPGRMIMSGDRLQLPCVSVIQMIAIAYGKTVAGQWSRFPPSAIEGPAWLHELIHYTVEARADRDVGEDVVKGPMLRALLEERFHLRVRQETRQSPAFALTVDRRGSKLKTFDGTCTPWDTPHPDPPTPQKPLCKVNRAGKAWVRDVDYHGFTLATVVQQLNGYTGDLGGPIIDRTGIEGLFDVHLVYLGGDGMAAGADVTVPGLPEALREQLGLTLEKITTPQEFLVIENIERPSGN